MNAGRGKLPIGAVIGSVAVVGGLSTLSNALFNGKYHTFLLMEL